MLTCGAHCRVSRAQVRLQQLNDRGGMAAVPELLCACGTLCELSGPTGLSMLAPDCQNLGLLGGAKDEAGRPETAARLPFRTLKTRLEV